MLLHLYFRPEQHFHSQGRTETVLQAFLSGNIVRSVTNRGCAENVFLSPSSSCSHSAKLIGKKNICWIGLVLSVCHISSQDLKKVNEVAAVQSSQWYPPG